MALTKFNYNSFDVTPAASTALAFNSDADGLTTAASGSMVLIKTLTASSDSTLEFVDGTDDVVLDNTYTTYLFKFYNMHPSGNQTDLTFNMSIDGGSNYNVAKTTSFFLATQSEAGSTAFEYNKGFDLAQGTGGQLIAVDTGNANDESNSGELWLFNPSSTTFVKHFMSKFNSYNGYVVVSYADSHYATGYGNTTSAVDAVQFQFDSGTIDTGTIKLFGIKDS